MSRTFKDRPLRLRLPLVGVRWMVTFPSADHVRQVRWRPLRARTGASLRLLAKQYRATGEIDDDAEPPPTQHRHDAQWRWW